MTGLNTRVERIEVAGRGGRLVRRHVVHCRCGWTSEPRTSAKLAEQRSATHEAEFCPTPGPVRVGVFEHGSPEWHAARASRLGGSEVAAVVGLSPWESRFSLWHRKSGLFVEDRDNDEMRAGREFEAIIAARFAANHPDWTVQTGVGTWVHRDRPWQLSNPDGLIRKADGRLALLEVKFALQDWQWGEPGTADVPVYYDCQAQWYADVFGVDEVHFAVFFGGSARHREYLVPAKADDQAFLREQGAAFLADVAAGVRPDIDGHDSTYEIVKALSPGIDPISVQVPEPLARAYCEARHDLARAELVAKEQTARLADHMGTAQYAQYGERRIARRQSKGGGTPYLVAERALPFDAPDIEVLQEAS
ncbi:MAG: YqaJ viral recombinase family protein [Jatrophihabitans sp.]|uniref:YqaJ viral recombinase family nuclease n=1 Tax=Jatrophihabitans sp. TaxID=1932789 RepID=UPI003F7EA5F2